MIILSISTRDIGGGAERFANDLNQSFRDAGHSVEEFVGFKRSENSDHRVISRSKLGLSIESTYSKMEGLIPASILNLRGFRRGFYYLRTASRGPNAINHELGRQGYHYPASWKLIDQSNSRPDLILAHNLHGDYFDLHALKYYSQTIPTFWVLHDEWAYTGRCAHTQRCQGWRQGCGICPDLTSYVSFPRDQSAFNLRVKKKIYQRSKLSIITPSRWIANRLRDSVLSSAIEGVQVIPYGIDQTVFRPGCQLSARSRLMIDSELFVVTFIAVNARNNPWKDYSTFESAAIQLAEKYPHRKILFFVIGDRHNSICHHQTRIEFIDGVFDKLAVRDYLIASDVYLHSARVDNYPLAVLEALSCGVPVIGSAVGGVPEQVSGYEKFQNQLSILNQSPLESTTGLLVDPDSSQQQVKALEVLLLYPELRSIMSANSVVDAQKRFNLARQSQLYVEWFNQVMNEKDL